MKEVKNKYKERDEIEAYFSDAKKKNFPIGVIFVILIMLLIGGCIYYYLIIDSPKNIFTTILKNNLNEIKIDDTKYKTISLDFSLETNIITNNKEYIETVDLLNKFALSGNLSEDLNEKLIYTNLNFFYESEDLINLEAYYEKNNTYFNIDKLYDKIIKVELEKTESSNINNSFENYDIEDREKSISSLKENVYKTLNNANYKKEYVKHNDTFVKKITLIIDKETQEYLLNNLISDNDFIESYSKLEGITKNELKESLKNTIKNLEDNEIKISLYLSILENKFIMAELLSEEYRLTLTKENNEYHYKYYENSIIKYQGYISLENNENNNKILFTIDDVEEQLNIEFNLDMTYEYDAEINKLDITNTKDYKTLTDTDYNNILEKITNDKNLNKLYKDISSLSENATKEETTPALS